jgi:hypothetical protein
MDLGNIVYIVAVIGYFIYQATRKKQHQEPVDEPSTSEDSPRKPVSFEELMREIREAQRPATAPEPAPAPQAEVSPVPQRRVKRPVRTYVEPEQESEVRYYEESFERSNKNPYQAASNRHSVVSDHEIKMNYDSVKSKKVNRYASVLKNPKTLRQAVIVSEILKPKHF